VSFLSRLFRGNASHGIIDDGTGVAILLELARFVQERQIPGTRFTFGFFGAEEAGLVGSAHTYGSQPLDKDRLHVISVDMIGEKPPLSYVKAIYPVRQRKMDAAFNEQIASIAGELGIEVKGKTFPYPGSDFGHFLLDAGVKTNWLISQSRLIHSKRDNLDNVNQALVQDALTLVVGYLLEQEGR
jgi:Zn-dependent M28 family amino/carboxypeptidase